jgi:hypothetical protein
MVEFRLQKYKIFSNYELARFDTFSAQLETRNQKSISPPLSALCQRFLLRKLRAANRFGWLRQCP